MCSWETSPGVTHANISWFNGTVFFNYTDVSSPRIMHTSYTSRGQTWACTVYITDSISQTNGSASATILNSPPENLALINHTGGSVGDTISLYENTRYIFALSAYDYDTDPVTYYLMSAQPSNSNFSSTGSFEWTPTYLQGGDTDLTFMASDGYAGSEYKKVKFQVILVNDEPYFSPVLQDKTAIEGQAFSYTITGADEESNYPLSFAIESPLGSRLIVTQTTSVRAVISFDTATGKPEFQDRGNYTVNITLTDSLGASAIYSFELEVKTVNHAPVIDLIPQQYGVQGDTFLLYVYATDLDNDTIIFTINDSAYTIETLNSSGDNALGMINISSLTNMHIVRRTVKISAYDGKEYGSQDVFFDFTNINDDPIIYEASFYEENTYGNWNLSNISAYVNSNFVFRLNYTDIDSYTYEGEVLVFGVSDNRFSLSQSGVFSFTPDDSMLGNHNLLITLTDDDGAFDTVYMNITVMPNAVPYFDWDLTNITCYEDFPCVYDIDATDPDIGDWVVYNTNLSFVLINSSTGLINFTPNATMIGNFSVNITITDSRGAVNHSALLITILNTNDPPVLGAFAFPDPVVLTHPVTVLLDSYDEDIYYNTSNDFLNYSVIITGPNTNLFEPVLLNRTGAIIQFTPSAYDNGTYLINLSVEDFEGLTDSVEFSLFIYEKSEAPVIEKVMPWGRPKNETTNFSWTNNTFLGQSTAVSFPENTTVVFNISVSDDDTALGDISLTWLYTTPEGSTTTASTGLDTEYILSYDYFDSGVYSLRVLVEDGFYENATFMWNVTVNNVNREPLLFTELPDLTLTGTTTAFSSYFSYFNAATKFIDPDDDLNSNWLLDGNETNTLVFDAEPCPYAVFTINGANLQIKPLAMGQCTIYFNATDTYNQTIQSNLVTINITQDPEQNPSNVVRNSGGSTSTEYVPMPEEVDVPVPLQLVLPQVVTLYVNQTLEVPIYVKNNWTTALREITLSAESNVSNVVFSFGRSYWSVIDIGETKETLLSISNYRGPGTYEIMITATVLDPVFEDKALVVVNSLESLSEGDDVMQKITFARDLLNDNPECQELNELLDKANGFLFSNNLQEAMKTVNAVINGCKYIVNNVRGQEEKTQKPFLEIIANMDSDYYIVIGSVLIVLFGIIMSLVIMRKVKG